MKKTMRYCIEIGLQDGEREVRIGCVYIPPDGSRGYSDEEPSLKFEWAQNREIVGGDTNWRCSKDDRATIARQCTTSATATTQTWRRASTRRERHMLKEWPHPLQALSPVVEQDVGTSVDWRTGASDMLGYTMARREWHSEGVTVSERRTRSPQTMRVTARSSSSRQFAGCAGRRSRWIGAACSRQCRARARGSEASGSRLHGSTYGVVSGRRALHAGASAARTASPKTSATIPHVGASGVLAHAPGLLLRGAIAARQRAEHWGPSAGARKSRAVRPNRPLRPGGGVRQAREVADFM